MTVEAVDRALDEVRPYLIADGGNVTVLDVVDGTVMLQLDVSGMVFGCPEVHNILAEGCVRWHGRHGTASPGLAASSCSRA